MHQKRLEAKYLRNTWLAEFKRMRKEMEPEKIERLSLLLKKLGIDPDQTDPPEIPDAEEKWRNYLLHQERLEAEYERNTWIAEIKRLQKEKEELQKETEELRKETEMEQKETEEEQKETEMEQKETEMEQKETEELQKLQKENERLLLLLKKAGIDPDQTVH